MLNPLLLAILLFLELTAAKLVQARFASSSQEKLKSFIKKFPASLPLDSALLKPFLVPRVPGTENNRKVRDFIVKTLKDLDWSIELDTFTDSTPIGRKEFSNVIATKHPQAHRKLVIAAHYDSKIIQGGEFIGATDSAVPCAIMLDIAKALNTRLAAISEKIKLHPDLYPTIQLIFFDGEEAIKDWTHTDSLYGSRHLAEKWANTFVAFGGNANSKTVLSTIDYFLLLDLLGTANPSIPNTNQDTTWVWTRLVDIEARLWKEKALASRVLDLSNADPMFSPASALAGMVDDDHRPFKERGVPIVHVIPQPFPDVWHTLNDNEKALDPDTINDLSKIFKLLVIEYLGLDI